MSKTIDALKKPDVRSQVHHQLQDEIARTYFKAPSSSSGRKRAAPKLPWIITGLALCALFAMLISRSNIDIRIRVLSEDAPSISEAKEAPPGGFKDKCVYFLKGAEINNSLIGRTSFSGDAKAYSRLTGSGVVLCNSRGSGWAGYTMRFKEPMDMTGLDMEFTASGGKGDERLGIALVDSRDRIYRIESARSPRLTKEPKIYKADFTGIGKMIDLSGISEIRFEFGSLTVGNDSMAAIFLNSVYASKTKRMRWL